MEDLKEEMRVGNLGREKLRKSFEEVRAQANSMLTLSLQWKEIESHLDLVQKMVEQRLQFLGVKEKEVDAKMRLWMEKENELGLLNKSVEDCHVDLKSKQEQVDLMQKRLEDCSLEFKLKTEDLDSIKKSIADCSKELSLKKKELCSVLELISECCVNLEVKEKQLRMIEGRVEKSFNDVERKLEVVTRGLHHCSNDTVELEHLKRSIDEKFRELELDLDLKENAVKECDEELESKVKELRCLQNSIEKCSYQLDLKQGELVKTQEVIEDRSKQLIENEKIINSHISLIEDFNEELQAKEEEYNMLIKSVTDQAAKLESKEKELRLIERKIEDNNVKLEDCNGKLQAKNKEFKVLNKRVTDFATKLKLNEKELELIEKTIKDRTGQFHSENADFDSLQGLIKETENQIELTNKKLDSVKLGAMAYSEDIQFKEQEFNAIQMRIEERRQELLLKEKQLSSVQKAIVECSKQLKFEEGELTSIKNTILKCIEELESKQQQLETLQKSREQLESKEKQVNSIEKTCSDRLQEVDMKQKHLDLLKRLLEERLEKLEKEKKQFEANVNEFELKQRQFEHVRKAVEQRIKELELKEKLATNAFNRSSSLLHVVEVSNTETVNPIIPNQIKTEQMEHDRVSNTDETSSADIGVAAAIDGTGLQSLDIEHIDMPDLSQNEIFSALHISPDPAKFVLDLMLGTCRKHGTGLEESTLMIYFHMLEQLLKLAPALQPKVRADALELATEWKAKMKLSAENMIEVLVFWLFITVFGLGTHFSRDESFKFLVTTPRKQQAQNFLSDKIQDIISCLLARRQYIEAVRFVCAFDCKYKLRPEFLLSQLWEDTKWMAHEMCMKGKGLPEVLESARNGQIVVLNSIIECIKNCKLEASLPVQVFEQCITKLEMQNRTGRFSASTPSPVVQPLQNWIYSNTTGPFSSYVFQGQPAIAVPTDQGGISASGSGSQLLEYSNKRARTDGPAIGSFTPPLSTINNPYFSSASNPYGIAYFS